MLGLCVAFHHDNNARNTVKVQCPLFAFFKIDHIIFLWGIGGTGFVEMEGQPQVLRAESIAVLMPGDVQAIYASDQPWEYCWWTIDGPQAEQIVTGFGFEAGVYSAGPAPAALIKHLSSQIERPGRDNEIESASIAYELLSCAAKYSVPRRTSLTDEALVNEAINTILTSWQDPDFGVEMLAKALRTHRSTLARRFKKVTNSTVIGYINSLRMRNAMQMLKHSQLPIKQIASRCGFRDPNYFARKFKTHYAILPSEFIRKGESIKPQHGE